MSWLINITDYSNATAAISPSCKGHQDIFWTCVTSVSFVLGFPGILAILVDMIQKRRKGTPFTPMEVFSSNLIVMDGLFLLSLLPELYNLPRNLEYSRFLSFGFSFQFCGRPLIITCICLDCYLAVVHPVTYRARKSLTPKVLMAVGVWTVTIAYGFFFATRSGHGALNDISLIIFLALTFPVIGFCEFFILWTLKKSNSGGKDIHPQKLKALYVIISYMIANFTTFLPPLITLLVLKFVSLDETIIRCLVVIPVTTIALIGNTLSLFVYLNNMGKLDWVKCWKQK